MVFFKVTSDKRSIRAAAPGKIGHQPARFFCALLLVMVLLFTTGCSRGYISSYSDNTGRKGFALTSVYADYDGRLPLYAEDFGVPGEGSAAEIGKVKAAGLFDLDDGKTVIEENITTRLYPASTTKIMTALLAIKYGDMDKMLTASAKVSDMEWEAQRIGIEEGDRMTMDQALHYLMVYSANDAGNLIAENIGKDYNDFIRMMNEEAARIGATNTHFVNPHGLHSKDHYTTAYDLFLIFKECVKYPKFLEIAKLGHYSTVFHDKNGGIRAIEVDSTDGYVKGSRKSPDHITVLGGKTGTTDQAGCCLIILSEYDSGRRFVSVILGAQSHRSLYSCMNRLLDQETVYLTAEEKKN